MLSQYIISIQLTWMVSLTTIYLIATLSLFAYTLKEQLDRSSGYFTAIMTYMADQTNLFILYNVMLSLAVVIYRGCVWMFLDRTLEGEIVKITDRLKIKIIDIVFFSYIIELRLDFQVYVVMVVLIFLFILHTHIALRSEFLVHVHSTSASLKQHYRVLALYLILFFFDYQVLKYSAFKLMASNVESEALFVYYMYSTASLLIEPFLQFIVDFYEKFTFGHIKNSDEFLAMAGLAINIPRLIIQILLSFWISYKFSQPFFFVISGIDNFSQLKKSFESFNRIRKLTTAMTQLRKVKGEELDQFHDLTCTVCYDDMKDAVMLPCKHIFHEECIRQWIVKNLNHFCPKCKKEFNFDNINNQYNQPLLPNQENNAYNHLREAVHEQIFQRPQEIEKKLRAANQNQTVQNTQRQPQPQRIFQNRDQSRNPLIEQERLPEARQQFSTINSRNENVPLRHYIINRPDLSEMPLEYYQAAKKKIVPVGSLPFGMPTQAVANRTQLHMEKRREYARELQVVLRLMSMNRNEQLLFL